MKMLQNKNIIVTGTAKGMGKTMVELFAKNGANVFALARSENDEHKNFCDCLSKNYNVEIIPIYFDMTDGALMKNAVLQIKKSGLNITGLVNNAGITTNSLFQMTDMGELKKQFEVNFFAPYLLTQYITKLMIKEGNASIVSISSSSALDCNPGKSAYGSSKAALLTMTKCISRELAESGIRANVICPGVVETEMLSTLPSYILDIQKEASSDKRLGKTIDIANLAMWLLSDESKYITGQVFRVDGGVTEYNKRIKTK